MSRKLKPVSPGEMLAEEFLRPLGMSNYRLAKEIGVPAQRIGEILAGKRAITADTDLRLCRFFGLSDGWWLRLQADYDTQIAKAALPKTLAPQLAERVAAAFDRGAGHGLLHVGARGRHRAAAGPHVLAGMTTSRRTGCRRDCDQPSRKRKLYALSAGTPPRCA